MGKFVEFPAVAEEPVYPEVYQEAPDELDADECYQRVEYAPDPLHCRILDRFAVRKM